MRKVLSKSKAPGVLRLAFHDAGTFDVNDSSGLTNFSGIWLIIVRRALNRLLLAGGMNGSIVMELDRPENAGLNRSVKVRVLS